MVAHGLVQIYPTRNKTAIVSGKKPSKRYSHAEHRLFRVFLVVEFCTRIVCTPYSYPPYNPLARIMLTERTKNVLADIRNRDDSDDDSKLTHRQSAPQTATAKAS
jgi:hypothetical protein